MSISSRTLLENVNSPSAGVEELCRIKAFLAELMLTLQIESYV